MGRHGGGVRADLGEGGTAAWDSITGEQLEELPRSMPARLQAVIDAPAVVAMVEAYKMEIEPMK